MENNSGKQLKVGLATLRAKHDRELPQVGITLAFKNGTGSKRDREGGAWTEPWQEGESVGVSIHQTIRGVGVVYSLGVGGGPGVVPSWCGAWDPRGRGEEVWRGLSVAGILDSAAR